MKERVMKQIATSITGQGNQIDISGQLSHILQSIIELAYTPYNSCKKIAPYLYELHYNNIDYTKAYEYFKNMADKAHVAQCTAVRNGDFVGRNLDELYDNSVSAIIRVSASDERYASMGVVSGIPTLTKALMESNENADILSLAPFFVTDAVNEHGLFAEINLLNYEESKGITNGTTPQLTKWADVNMLMLVRFIVDHFQSVDEAIEGLRNYVSVYAPKITAYEYHYLLADANKSVVIEFVNNEMVVIENATINSNFYFHGVTSNADGTITRNTSTDPNEQNVNGVTKYGSGIERYNIAVNGKGDAQSVETMKALMRELFFTHAYTLDDNQWYSEFVGGTETITSPAEEFTSIIQRAKRAYEERDRNNPITWQTIHSVVYDLHHKTITICVQESDTYYDFDFAESDNGVIGDLEDLETDHKSTIVEAINEVFDAIETSELVVSMTQSNADRKVIYNLVMAHPQIAKNIVFLNGSDSLYYRVNGYKVENNILHLHTIMNDTGVLRSIYIQIASNGSISIH